jgi:flagellin
MPLRLGTNITSINAGRHLNRNSGDFAKRVERLSSGLRINRGADDAAGLSVSEGMRAEILGMRQGIRNAEQGTSLIQLAEGSLNEVSTMLVRMRELAVTSANSTINDTNRLSLSSEFNQLSAEIDRIALSTTYNKTVLLTGFGNAVSHNSLVSTALDDFSGISEISVNGAPAGKYVFTDTSTTDNQVTLSLDLPDGTRLEQSIDMGTNLDEDGGKNLVATGTTFVANFDRLGVQVILAGPEVSSGTTSKLLAPTAVDGVITLENPDSGDTASVSVTAGQTLASIQTELNTKLAALDSDSFARIDADTGELQIDSKSLSVGGLTNLGFLGANSYYDGRLNGKSFTIEEGEGGVLQVGANDNKNNRISLNIGDMRASGTTLNLTGLSVANLLSSRGSIDRIDTAILNVARQRGDLGAVQNRLQFTSNNLNNAIENLQAAESAIRDADVAEEISAFTRAQILTQASTAMIAQANALPQNALTLLQ